MNGFLNIFKPAGKTSHDVVNIVRRVLNEKRVGHAGTLDPDAVGVLPVAVGKSTRLIDFLPSDKAYRFELQFGIETDSGDLTGKIVDSLEKFNMPSREKILQVFEKFRGEIDQIPPRFSAIKIHGRKAYDLARKDLEFEIPSRKIEIYQLDLLKIDQDEKFVECDVSCSKGTYIRSLCRDLGVEFGIPATMKRLIRTRSGNFSIEDSIQLVDVNAEKILDPGECLSNLPKILLRAERVPAFCNGLSTSLYKEGNFENVRVYSEEKFIGVGRVEDSELFPKVVMI